MKKEIFIINKIKVAKYIQNANEGYVIENPFRDVLEYISRVEVVLTTQFEGKNDITIIIFHK